MVISDKPVQVGDFCRRAGSWKWWKTWVFGPRAAHPGTYVVSIPDGHWR